MSDNHNTDSDSTEYQITFDGGKIPTDVFTMRGRFMQAFGTDYETAEAHIREDATISKWDRALSVDGVGEVDPHFFTDTDRMTAFLWTAEEAGQTGQRAADLSVVHMETDGDIELFFKRPKYAAEAFDSLPDDVAEAEYRFWIMNEAGAPGDQVLEVYDGGNGRFIDPWGDDAPGEYYHYVEGCEEFRVLDPENHPVSVIHTDMMYEHTDPVTIATTDGVYKFESRGGVMWDSFGGDEAPEWAWDTAAAVYGGELEGYERVGTGWHSSMEKSDLSDLINSITRGELHAEFEVYDSGAVVNYALGGDEPEPERIEEPRTADPVIVKFSGTGNVCSVGITVWTTPEFAPTLESMMDGKRAAPGYAGVR